MSLAQFIPNFLAESAQTTLTNVIRVLNNIQRQLLTILTTIGAKVQLDSIILQDVVLKQGTTTIPHTLGRAWSGFQIVKWNGTVGTVVDNAKQTNSAVYLNLTASTLMTVNILIF